MTYQYDALNRLTRAETADNAWGNGYTYDGWGNLTGKSVTKGSAPTFSQVYDPSLNIPVGTSWATYASQWDEDDRPTQGQAEIERESYGAPMTGEVAYDPSGKRVLWAKQGYFGPSYCEIYFNGITGQRLTRYRCGYSDNEEGQSRFGASLVDRRQHIGGQLTRWNATTDWMSGQFSSGAATTDRLGSVRARDGERYTYFPYGEPRTATVAAGRMFAGLETPVRAYDPGNGRFSTPDPLGLGAVKMGDPGSWNRFAYVQGDPVNFTDREGLNRDICGDIDSPSEYCQQLRSSGRWTIGIGYQWTGEYWMPYPVSIWVPTPSNGGPSGGRPDPQVLGYSYAEITAQLVAQGAMTDCEGLAAYAASMASITVNTTEFAQTFGVFVPLSDPSVQYANSRGISIAANTNPVVMLPAGTGSSGFAPRYQESLDKKNIDQTHHFAAFFQLGYSAGIIAGSGAAVYKDISPYNSGDVELGVAAAFMGWQVRIGALKPNQLASAIRNNLCNH